MTIRRFDRGPTYMEESMWTATIYDRMTAAEKLGWTFHPEDAKTKEERE